MATRQHAEAARKQHAEELRRLGAHAIEVREVRQHDKTNFVVVAMFSKKPPRTLPDVLMVTRRGKPVSVNLIAEKARPFGPE